MNDPKVTNQVPEPSQAPKQPYEKPEVIYRAPLEATAGLCPEGAPTYGKTTTPTPCSTLQS